MNSCSFFTLESLAPAYIPLAPFKGGMRPSRWEKSPFEGGFRGMSSDAMRTYFNKTQSP